MEIEHFSHHHPLIPNHSTENGFGENECGACESKISRNAPSYGCLECKFYIHEYCARLEREIQNPYHPQHPLFLTLAAHISRPSRSKTFSCYRCSKSRKGFSYHCSECDFVLDLECALQDLNFNPTITFQFEGHKLVLSHLPRVKKSLCFVCEGILEPPVFKCEIRECKYAMHFHCAPLAFRETIQHKHLHRLMFREKFIEDDTGEYYCDACEERRDPDIPVYYCVQCFSLSAPYTAHMACVLTHEVLQSLIKEYESSDRFNPPQQHHQHHLTLSLKRMKAVCIVCKRNLSYSWMLTCEKCEFYLHYGCRELETEIKHPTHSQHSLTLHVDATTVGPFFQCNACKEMCLCFIYHCNCCNFNLCVRCWRRVQTTTMFEYQNHKLFLFNFNVGGGNCEYCGSDRTSHRFICMETGCMYNLHFLCAPLSLPQTVEVEFDRHPLTLTDNPACIKCGVCDRETESPEDGPYYRCEECDRVAHASCALLEHLPELLAKFENSPIEEKITRLNSELQRIQMEEEKLLMEEEEIQNNMKIQLRALETQMREKKGQLMKKSENIETYRKAILQPEELHNDNASSE